MHDGVPSLDDLGRDLLRVSSARKALCLALPFVVTALFFVFAVRGWWIAAVVCTMVLSFITYGSVSHDLVHRNLNLPPWVNEPLLAATELLTFRSGHAYRWTHLHHHARFPADDDIEGAAAAMPWWRALLDGVTLQPRLWAAAMRHRGAHRAWAIVEASTIIVLLAAATRNPILGVYALLVIGGSWIFPFITSYLVHDPHGTDELSQTRLFRGRMFSLLAFEHLYHLEHHLFPQVPHQRWPELARRLDPFFESHGVRPVRLFR
jgi:beta-carotene hydroxylase